MRRVIRRRIRHTQDGLDVAIDFNADIAVNVGRERPPAGDDASAREDESDPDRPATTEAPDEGEDR